MDKEEFLKSVVGLYNEATDKAIREIAEKAFKEGYQAAMAERPEEASYLPIKDDELEWHDTGLEDGYRVAFVEEAMPWNEANAKYLLPTYEQLHKIIIDSSKNVFCRPGSYSESWCNLLLNDGCRIPIHYYNGDFFWSQTNMTNDSYVEGIKILRIWKENYLFEFKSHDKLFKGEKGRVVALKKFE